MKAPTPAGVPVMTAVKAGIVVPIRFHRTYVSYYPEKNKLQNSLAVGVVCNEINKGGGRIWNT